MTKSIVSPFTIRHQEYYPIKIDNINHNALAGSLILANTSSNSINITLPATPKTGNTLKIIDTNGTFRTNNCIIKLNGEKCFNSIDDINLNIDYTIVTFYYISPSIGWVFDISNMLRSDKRILEITDDIMLSNDDYMLLVNTSSKSINITLPTSPLIGTEIKIIDIGNNLKTNNCILMSSNKINNKIENYTLKINNSTIILVYDGKNNWVISNTSSDSSGSSNDYIKILHSNAEDNTESNEYIECYNCEILPDPNRINKSDVKFIISTKGVGVYKISISDGVHEVIKESDIINSNIFINDEISLDCSILDDVSNNKSWNIIISFKAVSGIFTINRILCKIKNISPFILNNLISTNIYKDCASTTYELIDYGYLPSNVIQDYEYRVKFLIQLSANNTDGSCKIKLSGKNVETLESSFEESEIIFNSGDSIKSSYVYLPSTISTQIKYEIFGKINTVGKIVKFKNYELNLEV